MRSVGVDPVSWTRLPSYDSGGLLHSLYRDVPAGQTRYHVFYLAGRPVGQVATEAGEPERWWYFTTDHLGTPVVATDGSQDEMWVNRFDPFGEDPFAGTASGALAQEVFLRFPGQWDDQVWRGAMMGAEGYYNVHRWLHPGTGRYTRTDPLGRNGDSHPYLYAQANPLRFDDPLGLKSRVCCQKIPYLGAFRHCAIEIEQNGSSSTCGLFGGRFTPGEEPGVGQVRPNHPFDRPGSPGIECGPWKDDCEVDQCVIQTANSYANPSKYRVVRGPNSNSFAGNIARRCGLSRPQNIGSTPGWDDPPAPPIQGREQTPGQCKLP